MKILYDTRAEYKACLKKDRTFATKTLFFNILSTVHFKVVPSTGDTPFPTYRPLLECFLERTFCDGAQFSYRIFLNLRVFKKRPNFFWTQVYVWYRKSYLNSDESLLTRIFQTGQQFTNTKSNFGFPLRFKGELRSSRILRFHLQGPSLSLDDGTDRLTQNVEFKIPFYAAENPRTAQFNWKLLE
jgi:hypothetical protein